MCSGFSLFLSPISQLKGDFSFFGSESCGDIVSIVSVVIHLHDPLKKGYSCSFVKY